MGGTWQAANHFPTLDYWTAYKDHGTNHMPPLQYLITLIITMNPFLFPLWIIGVYNIFKSKPEDKKIRKFLGVVLLTSALLIYLLNGKSTMLAALFIPLIAFVSIFVEEKLRIREKLKTALVVYICIGGLLLLPLSIPLLPPETIISIMGDNSQQQLQLDNNKQGQLPAHFATRFGWDNMAQTVSKVFNGLSKDEQEKCGIFASDYDQAGAIDLLGPKYGLPKSAISGRLTYYLWGYGNFDGKVMLSIGLDEEYLKKIFNEVTLGEIIQSDYAMPEDTNLPVYICRGLKIKVVDFWKDIKNY